MAVSILEHYRTLGVERGATLRRVRRAYKKLAMKFHPDRGGSEERMKAINVAYEAILARFLGSRTEEDDREPHERVQTVTKRKPVSVEVPARAHRVELREPGFETVTVGYHWGPEQIAAAKQALRA